MCEGSGKIRGNGLESMAVQRQFNGRTTECSDCLDDADWRGFVSVSTALSASDGRLYEF